MEKAIKRMISDPIWWARALWAIVLLAALVLTAHEAMASGDFTAVRNRQWEAECGSCHIAYPPRLLPPPAWQRLMATLDRHFGTDASLDAAAAAEVGTFLEQHAGRDRRISQGAGELRITRTAWFVGEHRKVPADAWRHPTVKSAVNCAACHSAAASGDFRERNIRIPR